MRAKHFTWILCTAAGAAALATAQTTRPPLPEGPGKQILETVCTECHTLNEVVKFSGYYSRENWRDILQTMVADGARLTPAQTPVLLDYLTQTFPKNLPDGEGKKLLEAACAGCHPATDVQRFDGYYDRENWRELVGVMIANGAKLTAPQATVLVDYLTATFPKMKTP